MDTAQNQVIDQLARTKGWTLFIAILLWITSALMLIGAIVILIMAVVTSQSDLPSGGRGVIGSATQLIPTAVLYILMAFFNIFPALKLSKFSSNIKDLIISPSEDLLAQTLNEMRIFWKYLGIVTIAYIALMIVFIGISVFVGFSATRGFG